MRLYLMNDGRIRHKWWCNFRDHCIKIKMAKGHYQSYLREVDIQLEAYSAKIVDDERHNWPLAEPYIEFADERDATMFILRWS